ncbi:WD40 repeat domain-containing protein [Streptomyces sp. ME19-01-6]|uniref:WD40 repeat domain-containing protein n=1 Tax=Streptomyces sp. ME19-01-6 TaxID=3028686 RepID=UPI0029A2DF17|nr:WD40 repeat domain-containing protein [Streptomyces sp. ME19-01-6]MDX3225179.1 WD40 repeat domain-containing protein [Streptomyces sp. ME19-01-6]
MKLTVPPTPVALTNPSLVTCVAISPDSRDVVVGQVATDEHPALSRWSLPGLSPLPGPEPCPLAPDRDTCNVLARSEQGLLAVAGMSTQQLVVMDTAGGARTTPVDGAVMWAALAGGLLASSGTETRIQDLASGRIIWRQQPSAPREPSHSSLAPQIAFRPDQQAFAVGGSGEPTILVYPLAGADTLPDADPLATLSGAPERLRWLGFSPGGEYLVAVDAYANSTVIWRSGDIEPHLPDLFGEHAHDYWSIALHPDGEHCAMGMLSGYIDLYRLSDGELLDSQQQHLGRVQALAFAPDGSLLLSGGDDGKLLAWPVG